MALRGAPKGNKNASKSKDWEGALRRVLATFILKSDRGEVLVKRGAALRAIAETCVRAAIMGDFDAIREIGNRIDGKATEHVTIEKTVAHLTYADYLTTKVREPRGADAESQEPPVH